MPKRKRMRTKCQQPKGSLYPTLGKRWNALEARRRLRLAAHPLSICASLALWLFATTFSETLPYLH